MKSTYLNDGMLSTYPFASDADLPMSRSCIASLGICLKVDASSTENKIKDVYVSNINITDNEASLSFRTDTGVYLGILKITPAGGTSAIHVDGIDGHMFGTLGIVDARSIGTYTGHWAIDPDCVNIVNISDSASALAITGAGANSVYSACGPVLTIDILGDVYVSLLPASEVSGAPTDTEKAEKIQKYAVVKGAPKDGSTYIKTTTKQNAAYVYAINGVQFPVKHRDAGEPWDQEVFLEVRSTSPSIAVVADGDALILSGHGKFPACYGNTDRAKDIAIDVEDSTQGYGTATQ